MAVTAVLPARLRPRQRRLPSSSLAAVVLLGLVCGLAWALDFPALTGRVVDDANVISPVTRTSIDEKSKELEEKSGIQLVVATVKSLQGGDIETFANQLFRTWKLGEAKKNNGVLLVVAPAEHKARIEVGYGLEGTLTDALAQVIIAGSMVPRFKANDYSDGIARGVDGIISVLSTDASEWKAKPKVRSEDEDSLFDVLFPILLFLVVVFIFRRMLGNARGPSGTLSGRRGGTVFIPYGGSSWDSGSGWGGGSSWGGSSGGGGFAGGGGSSGGGGASGSW